MDDQKKLTLDEDFKNILLRIRPYIVNLTDPHYIKFCRVWMEKLSECQPDERAVRNEYLNELYRQMQHGIYEEPFLSFPPEGALPELTLPGTSNSWSDISSTSTIATIEVPASGDSQIDEGLIKENEHPLHYEKKIEEQQHIIVDLQMKNDLLTKQLNSQFSARNAKTEVGMNMMASEVEYLKERLRELIMMKKNLQASHNAIILQWEEATHNLEYELRAEKLKNNELEIKIQELQTNLNKIEKSSDTDDSKQKLLAAHHEEICDIKDKHNEVIKYIEEQKSLLIQQKVDEYEAKICEIKENYELRIEEMKNETEKESKFREEEIARLEKLIEEQCNRMHEEVIFIRTQMDQDATYNNTALLDKIAFLQNCILKMEKLLRKYERHYSKKICVLTNELIMKENTMQIQLTTQRAQLLSKASTERQLEVDDIVTQLERRYRQLLEDQQCQVTEIRQDYLNIIKQLTDKFEIKSITG